MPKLTCILASIPFYVKLITADVGRRLEGERLARIVVRDLEKKEKSTTANRDPHLELNLCDKKLGETGFSLVCGIKTPQPLKYRAIFSWFWHLDSLLSAIESQAIKLDDLNLSCCDLPASSLAHLAQVVAESAETLQNLNLMGNHLDLSSTEELRAWETFLVSFRHCTKMRTLNMSDNRLGDKGIETFVRVYLREMANAEWDDEGLEHIAKTSFSGPFARLSIHDSDDDSDGMESVRESLEDYPDSSPLAPPAMIKARRRSSGDIPSIPSRGLRTIAYIDFSKVGMTDLAALHLTYFLPYHRLPHVLLRRLDPQIPESGGDELYDPESFCRGITLGSLRLDQGEFSPLAKKILEHVEKVRRAGGVALHASLISSLFHGGSFLALSGSVPPSPDVRGRTFDSPKAYIQDVPSPPRKDGSGGTRSASVTPGRSASVTSTGSIPLHVTTHWNEVVKTRPKLQGEILKVKGTVHISQLWAAAIKLFSLSRIFILSTRPKPPTFPAARLSGKPRIVVKVSLPPTPTSPVRLPKWTRGECVGGLERRLWLKILLEIADPEGCLSGRQALQVLSWAADRGTLAKEGEWAGKLPHVQMWKLLDVYSPLTTVLMGRGWSV